MESSQEVHQLTKNRHATVVQYDLTSSEDELDEDHSYIYCSATKLSPMPPQNSDEENEESAVNLPSSQDSESNEEEELSQRKRPPVIQKKLLPHGVFVFGHPSRYESRKTGLNFVERTTRGSVLVV